MRQIEGLILCFRLGGGPLFSIITGGVACRVFLIFLVMSGISVSFDKG